MGAQLPYDAHDESNSTHRVLLIGLLLQGSRAQRIVRNRAQDSLQCMHVECANVGMDATTNGVIRLSKRSLVDIGSHTQSKRIRCQSNQSLVGVDEANDYLNCGLCLCVFAATVAISAPLFDSSSMLLFIAVFIVSLLPYVQR